MGEIHHRKTREVGSTPTVCIADVAQRIEHSHDSLSACSQTILHRAVDVAMQSENRIKVGCVIFDKKKVISTGHNEYRLMHKLHPKFQKFMGSVHAEAAAIINSRCDLKGMSLVVVRVNTHRQLRMAKPCERCMAYIEFVGIRHVYYSVSEYPYMMHERVG